MSTVSGASSFIASLGEAPTPRPATVKTSRPAAISSGVMAGQLITKTQPVYPPIARAAHVSGTVVLRAIIGKDGSIRSLQAVSGSEMLRASAIAAVESWRYRPYLLNGEPTEVDTTVTVNFAFS